jgi:predicted glutamine amidotransferase
MCCGIVGLFGADCSFNTDVKREFLIQGLWVDALRGNESTGLAILPKDKDAKPKIYKRAISGPDFVQLKPTLRLISGLSQSFGAIGHNRSMTRGFIDDESSHPFQYKHITLVHNGTVQNAEWLITGKNESDSKVDSAQVAWAFSEEDPDKLLPKMTGGFSLVWWDSRDCTLHFARNTERPMYWITNTLGSMMYYASELDMLKMLVNRNQIQCKSTALFSAPYVHYVFKDPTKLEEFEKRPFVQKLTKKQRKQNKGPSDTPWEGLESAIPTDTATKNNSSSLPTATGPITIINPEKGQPVGGLQPDGSKHPVESETISRGVADTVRTTNSVQWRKEELVKRATNHGLKVLSSLIVTPRQWSAYKDETKLGHMLCTHNSGTIIQVFDVTLGEWNEYCAFGRIPVEINNFRNNYDQGTLPVFVAYVNKILYNNIKATNNKKPDKVYSHKTASYEYESEDLIEVGNRNPKFVSPKVFHDMTSGGCMECSRALTMDSKILWLGHNEACPLCETCGTNPVIVKSWEQAAGVAHGDNSH